MRKRSAQPRARSPGESANAASPDRLAKEPHVISSPASRSAAESASAAAPPASSSDAAGAPVSAAPDAAWISAAVSQFQGPLIHYASRLLSGDVERARDVVQDAFLRLWSADRASVDGHLGQWLYRVCRNRALDVRRKEVRMTALSDEHIDVIGQDTIAFGRRSHDRGNEHESASAARTSHELSGHAVMGLLESLSDMQQEALRLKFQGGLSYREIATVMDITVNHVGVIIHNAIKALRERMLAQESSARLAASRVRP